MVDYSAISTNSWELYGGAATLVLAWLLLSSLIFRHSMKRWEGQSRGRRRCCPDGCYIPAKLLARNVTETESAYSLLFYFWLALGIRIIWLVANGIGIPGTTTQCLSGTECAPQVFITLANRISQMMYFVVCSKFMRYLSFAAHAKAFGFQPWIIRGPKSKSVGNGSKSIARETTATSTLSRNPSSASIKSDNTATSRDPNATSYTEAELLHMPPEQRYQAELQDKLAELPVMGWDLSHVALDWWMVVLQVATLFITLGEELDVDSAYPVYEAYQLQVATLYLLLGLLYGILAYQCRYALYAAIGDAFRRTVTILFPASSPAQQAQVYLGEYYETSWYEEEGEAPPQQQSGPTPQTPLLHSSQPVPDPGRRRITSTGPKRIRGSGPGVTLQPVAVAARSPAGSVMSAISEGLPGGHLAPVNVVPVALRPPSNLNLPPPNYQADAHAAGQQPQAPGRGSQAPLTPVSGSGGQPATPAPPVSSAAAAPSAQPLPPFVYHPHAYASFAASCAFVCIVFIMRTALFLYTPVEVSSIGTDLASSKIPGVASKILYPWFFYIVPEALPPLLILHMLLPEGAMSLAREVLCFCCYRHKKPATLVHH